MLGKREREEEGVEEMDNSEWRTAGDSMRSSTSKRMTVPTSVAASSVDEDLIPPRTNYEVFISFRGKDTRDNFTSHLYDALCRKKIKTFIDNRLNRGEEISSTLRKTIQESEIYVIIFSKDYASSTWCLDEVAEILKWNERYERLVIPVFHNIDPSYVRRQTGSYADSFAKHAQRFKNDMDKVHKWKAALKQASNLSGLDSAIIRPETKLIRKIVKDISRKLRRNSSYDLEGLVGIHEHISAIESFLNIGSQDVKIIGIWGMGGIGKTTIADAIFHKLQAQFESCSFVLGVEEQLRTIGLNHIRDKYLQELLEEDDIGIHSFRSLFVKKLLGKKKILLVLDNVNKLTQIKDLIRRHDWFGPGSIIIITTRDRQVLRIANANQIYHVKEMNYNDALKLFSIKAFEQDLPIKEYEELSKEAVNYCKGIPLALTVLGSFFNGRTEQEWKSSLKRLQNAPHIEIFDVLKLSFDGLDDDQKEIFLDIALFHDGKKTSDVRELLNSCGFFADIGLSVLMDRSLISIQEEKIIMHDLIKAMGHEIVCHPNVYKSGIGRRLRKHEDIYNALKKRKITEEIYGISLDMSQIKEIILRANAFKKMDSLKILKFYSHFDGSRLRLPNGLRNLPEELISFQWDGYPHRCVPLNSCAENIVELIMTDSHVKRLWNGNQHLPNLKTIILQRSKHLIGIPDLSMAPNIRHLDVSWCPSLAQVYSSGFLPDLQNLYLIDCDAMKTVNIGGNKIERRSWRLLADYEFFILCFPCTLHKVHMKIFKSDNSNTYTFRFNSVSAQLGRILESESSDYQSLGLALVHLNLKSALPNLELLCLSDNPPSIGSLSEHLYFNFCYSCGIKGICMLCTSPRRTRQQKFSVPPKGTGNKEVLGSSWDWEDLIGINDSIMDQNIYICNCRLSKIPSNNIHWPCLTQVSLHRNESNGILNFLASVCDEVSRSDLLLLYDCTRRQFTEEFTFSLDSENPQKISDIHFNLGDKQNLHHRLAIYFSGEEWSEKKTIYSGGDNYCQECVINLFLQLHLL